MLFAIVSFALSCATWSAAAPARKIADAVTVNPNACLERGALAREISRWLKREEVDAGLSVAVQVAETRPAGVSFVIRRDGVLVGERAFPKLEGTCAELRAALGLAIALALDASVLDSLGVRSPARVSPPPSTSPNTLSADVGIAGLANVLPEPALGIGAGVDVLLVGPLDARLSVLAAGPVSFAVGAEEARASLVAGQIVACGAWRRAWLRSRACVGAAGGRWQASGEGLSPSYAPNVAWAAAVLRLDARFALGSRFGILLGLDGLLPFVRPNLDILRENGAVLSSRAAPAGGITVTAGPSVTFL
jgi:hypothetical protein